MLCLYFLTMCQSRVYISFYLFLFNRFPYISRLLYLRQRYHRCLFTSYKKKVPRSSAHHIQLFQNVTGHPCLCALPSSSRNFWGAQREWSSLSKSLGWRNYVGPWLPPLQQHRDIHMGRGECLLPGWGERHVGRNLDGFIPHLHLSDIPLKHPGMYLQ